MPKTDLSVALGGAGCVPSVGASIAEDLWSIGVRSLSELARRDPQALYDQLRAQAGMRVDRRILYVLRCAVYLASTPNPDPELLQWWRWADPSDERASA